MNFFDSRVWLAWAVLALEPTVSAQVTKRVSVASDGSQVAGLSTTPSISGNGQTIVFASVSSHLVPGDTNGVQDIFVHDRLSGTTQRVSVSTGDAQSNALSQFPAISRDGRFVAFASNASNLVAGDTNSASDVFVRDRATDTTERVSIATSGIQGLGNSYSPSLSVDGRYVSFHSNAPNFFAGDSNLSDDVFVRDRISGVTEIASIATSGTLGNDESAGSSISADGRYVTFASQASNLVTGDSNGFHDVFVRDRLTGTTEIVSVSTGGSPGNDLSAGPRISPDGRFVVFVSDASNLVAGDTNGALDVFVRDRMLGTTERESLGAGGVQGSYHSFSASMSADDRWIAFVSSASNLVAGDTNAVEDIFLRDRVSGAVERISVSTHGAQANGSSNSWYGAISDDGRFVPFQSHASNLVALDTNMSGDIFLHDRDANGFTSACDPLSVSVIDCPCGNPPSASGLGCDNSSSTGGAVLVASGIAYVTGDTLMLTSIGEKPTALSIVLQGDADVPNGFVFGQGVRCAGGNLLRLYTKTASAGSITAPDLGAGDPTVSARAAALGDAIQAGDSRWYLVYYRDPNVLGGCPAASTFNATQTGRVDWSL